MPHSLRELLFVTPRYDQAGCALCSAVHAACPLCSQSLTRTRRVDLNIAYIIWLRKWLNGCKKDESRRVMSNGMNMMEIDPGIRKDQASIPMCYSPMTHVFPKFLQ